MLHLYKKIGFIIYILSGWKYICRWHEMKYKVHKQEINMVNGQEKLEQFLNGLIRSMERHAGKIK